MSRTSLLNSVCKIYRKVQSNVDGFTLDNFALIYDNEPCRFRVTGEAERVINGKETPVLKARFYLESGLELNHEDVIVIENAIWEILLINVLSRQVGQTAGLEVDTISYPVSQFDSGAIVSGDIVYNLNETDPVFEGYRPFIVFEDDNISRLTNNVGYITCSGVPACETDPIFTASPAFSITEGDIITLSNTSGVNMGDQYIPSALSEFQNDAGFITSGQVPSYETDPVFTASPANSITSGDIVNLSNLSGTNTGDQYIPSALSEFTNDGVFANVVAFTEGLQGPTGFENRTDSVIVYDNVTRTISVSATVDEYNYWLAGEKYTGDGIPLSGVHPNTTGGYFFYIDENNAVQFVTTPWDIQTHVSIAYLYYSAVKGDGFVFEERHSSARNPIAHQEFHRKIGTYYVTGLAAAGYTEQPVSPIDADNIFSIATGVVADEDLQLTITALTDGGPYYIFYRSGVTGEWIWTTNTVPFTVGASYAQYNQYTGATWQLTDITNNEYFNIYVVAFGNIDTTKQIAIIVGQNKYASESTAQGATFINDIAFGGSVPFQEISILHKFTYRGGSSYTSTGKVRINKYADLRGSTSTAVILAGVTSNHNSLAGLQGGAAGEYYHLTNAQYTAALAVPSTYVPYTGGTTDVNLGAHNLTVDTNVLFADATNNRVGVGTATPTYPLSVNGRLDVEGSNILSVSAGGRISVGQSGSSNANAIKVVNTSAATVFNVDSTNNKVSLPLDNAKLIFGTGSDASIYYDGTNLTIDAQEVGSGNIVIGGKMGFDISPTYPIDLQYTNSSGGINETGLRITNTATGNSTQINLNGYKSWSMQVDGSFGGNAGGMVFVNNTGSVVALELTQAGVLKSLPTYSSIVGGTNRDLYIDNNGTFGYVSSTRESKTNIEYAPDTSWIYDLKPVSFNYRKKDIEGVYTEEAEEQNEIGLIAEDVVEVNEDIVYKDEDGNLEGVAYSKLIPALLNEIQNLKKEIEILKGK